MTRKIVPEMTCNVLSGTLNPTIPDCQLVIASGRRQLRSSDANTCVIRRTRTLLGGRSFAVAGPRLWNNLPVGLRHINLFIRQFRSALKTHLFNWVGRLVTLFLVAPYKCSYLLTSLLLLSGLLYICVMCLYESRQRNHSAVLTLTILSRSMCQIPTAKAATVHGILVSYQ